MNTIGLGNQYETINFQKEYEYDSTKWKTKKIDFDRKLTYESTDTWVVLDEKNNKVRKSDTKPFTIYITTRKIDINIQFGNDDHILTYWGDNKSKIDSLLKEQIDEGNIRGKKELVLIGDFKQDTGVLYAQYNSKYKPFRDEFPKKSELERMKKLIDVQKSFRLEFKLADIAGEQYKVLNDTNSVIIDGSAGTGKSTIALQKLKYLELNKKVPQEKMLVIVKNKQVISHFKTLLEDKELLLNNVQLKEVSVFLDSIYLNLGDITKDYLIEINKKSFQIRKNIEKSIKELNLKNLNNHLIVLFNDINIEVLIKSITKFIAENNSLMAKTIKNILASTIDIKAEENRFHDKLKQIKWSIFSNISWKISKYSFYYTDNLYDLNHFRVNTYNIPFVYDKNYLLDNKEKKIEIIKEKLDSLRYKKEINEQKNKRYEKALKSLNNSEIDTLSIEILKEISDISTNEKIKALYWIKKYILDLKNLEKNKDNYEKLEEKLYKSFKKNKNEIDNFKNILQKIYFTEQFILDNYLMSFSSIEKFLILNYIFSKREKALNTIIVDEAQDYTLVELELLRFQANRIILTGDILQNIENIEIREWTDILNINDVYQVEDRNGEERLNIFTLKHNYRQTYQLANASYNLRQLLLDRELEDIEKEYWVSEKEFNSKPYQLVKVFFNQYIEQHIKEKIDYITNTFTSQIPIVLIYKTNQEKEVYEQRLSRFRLSYDTYEIESIDVILVNILEAKGKQFPIVVSNLDDLSDREIYFIMTRGQFEVEFLSSEKEIDNKYLETLKSRQWIEIKDIEFRKKNKEDVSKLTCFKCNKNFFNANSLDQHMASKKHREDWDEYFSRDDVKKRLLEKKLIHNQEKGQLVKQKSSDKNVSSSELIKNDLLDAKIKHEEGNNPKTKKQIPKHKAKTTQYDEKLDLDIITDEEKYQKDFIKKIQEDIKNLDSEQQEEFIEKIIVVRKKSTNKKSKELRDSIKNYLMNTYKGYCQVCGFSFRKVIGEKNSFEMFNWNDKRVVKQKKSFVTTADSLCLCRNCSANIKWGAFNPIFIDKINDINGFSHKSLDEIKDVICIKLEDEIVNRFKKDYDWDDMYALEITVNDEPKNIYMTNGHLIQFIAYLQLEEGNIND